MTTEQEVHDVITKTNDLAMKILSEPGKFVEYENELFNASKRE